MPDVTREQVDAENTDLRTALVGLIDAIDGVSRGEWGIDDIKSDRAAAAALLAGEGTAQADPRATGVTWRNIVTCTGDASYAAARGGTAHACPEGDDGVTPCCGRSPLDLPITDQLTTCDDLVTCNG